MQATCLSANMASHLSVERAVPTAASERLTKPERPMVYVVDGDVEVHETVSQLLTVLEMEVTSFESSEDYLEHGKSQEAGCLIVDMHLQRDIGLDPRQQTGRAISPPIILIGNHPDVPTVVRAMKAGAIEMLTKPLNPAALVAAVHEALAQDRRLRVKRAELARLQRRFSLLTPREREVVPLIVGGLLNKQAASILGISEVTLQIHRSQVMRKMEAESFADLVRMAIKLRIPHWQADNRSSNLAAPIYSNKWRTALSG
jgi:FixJ family two-component response regulator